MTTLNEKAREYAHKLRREMEDMSGEKANVAYEAYIAGATEMSRWRDVNVEKIPCEVEVILKNGDKYVGLGFFYDCGFESCDGSKFFKVKFTHWRPIETI